MDVQLDHGEKTYKGSNRLKGRKTVITGGDSGIGRAVALAFAREGADVLISYLESEEKDAQETVRLIEDAGRKAVTVPGGLRDEAMCQRVVDTAVREFGRIDVLVSNAAFQMARTAGSPTSPASSSTGDEDERLCAVLADQGRSLAHVRGLVDHHDVGAGFLAVAVSAGLRDVQGRHRELHQGSRRRSCEEGHQSQFRGAGSGVDAADSRDDGRGEGEVVWGTVADGSGRTAGRARPSYVFLASQESSYITADVIAVTGGSPIV
jgi:NAD(P)-dependent dehydrogenase (short-subunit alcohol dehydrogenase family)